MRFAALKTLGGLPALGLSAAIVLAIAIPGCVRRTMTITTEPPNALVYLNDQEIGRTKVTTDFLWYGDYDVVIRKEGFQTLSTNWPVKAPWYQYVPFDFFAEALWPGQILDARARHFVLQPTDAPTPQEVIERAMDTRDRAEHPLRQ